MKITQLKDPKPLQIPTEKQQKVKLFLEYS